MEWTRLSCQQLGVAREGRELAQGLAGREGVDRALARIRSEQERYRRRIALLARPRIKRVLPVLRTWMSGDYDYFAGWKSAAKDMFRC